MAAMDSKEEECIHLMPLSHSFLSAATSPSSYFYLSLIPLLPPLAISRNKNGSNKLFNVIQSKYVKQISTSNLIPNEFL